MKQKLGACAEETASLVNDNDNGDYVRIDVGDLEVEVIEYKESYPCTFKTWREVAVGFIIIALLVLYAYLLCYVLAMGGIGIDDEEIEGATYAYLGTHM